MHILITGAAGMIGRKLSARLVKDGQLNGQKIDRLTLIDVVAPEKPTGFGGAAELSASDLSSPGAAAKAIAGKPDVIFHLAGVVSGEAETDFDKGYRVNLDGTRALLEEIRAAGYKPKVVFTSSIAVYGAPFPASIADEFQLTPAHILRYAKGDLRIAARRLQPARHTRGCRYQAADDLRAARQAEQGGIRLLLRDHPRTVGRARGIAAGFRKRATYARQPALRCRLSHPRRGIDAGTTRATHQPCDARCLLHGRRANRRAAPCRR